MRARRDRSGPEGPVLRATSVAGSPDGAEDGREVVVALERLRRRLERTAQDLDALLLRDPAR